MTPRVFLAIPVNRDIHPSVLDSILHVSSGYINNAYIDSAPSKYLDDKRNDCVKKFLETDCTHIIFWDSDTVADANVIDALVKHDLPIISPVIYKKGGAHEPCFGYWDPLRRLYRTPMPFPYNEMLKVDIVGTGFLLVKREVFESLTFPWFECGDDDQSGEDVYFSLKCREADIPIYVDTSIHLGHIATPYVITNETYEMYMFWKIVKDIMASGRLEEFSKILMDFTGKKHEELVEQSPHASVTMKPTRVSYTTPTLIREAYLDYIQNYSKPEWAMSWELIAYIDRFMQQIKPKRILDLGSGFSSFLFRLSGAEVTSIDASPAWLLKTEEFLKKYDKFDGSLSTSLSFDGMFDIIFLDYDAGDAIKDRIALFEKVREHCSGVIFLDDMQFDSYRLAAADYFKNDIVLDLKIDTLDRYYRYAWMVIPRANA